MKQYDLIVVGGGLTGVAAAVSAGREGLKVLLVEQSGSLGGAMITNLVFPFMRYWTTMPESGEKKYLSAGIFEEMCRRQNAYIPALNETRFNPESFKLVLDDMCAEAGVQLLFHATLCGVTTEDRLIKSIQVATKAGVLELTAGNYIDATGDGDLLAFAGCEFQLGREADSLCQPMTTCFRMSGVDLERFAEDKSRLQALYKERLEAGQLLNPRENILTFTGLGNNVLHFNTTRVVRLNPTDPFDVSRAEVEARKQIFEMVTFLQENSEAFRGSTLVSVAASIGVRESRKLKGVHILTQEELKACTRFEDSIALGNYDIDIHNPEGAGTSHYYFPAGEYYTIPYRSLLPKEFDNLLVGGRCISATHEAQASIRIMPICATLGQAAGIAAAVAHDSGANIHTVDIPTVQRKLRENGAAID